MSRRRSHDDGRGQTLPDFVVGIAIFLITVAVLIQVIPQLLAPYDQQEQPVVVQRVASDLENHLLAAEGSSSELNESCTLAFFNQAGGAGCPFDSGEALTTQLGIGETYSVNVSLRTAPSDDPGSTLLCDEGGEIDDCGGGSTLAIGPAVPESGRSVAVARRRVFVGSTQAVIEVGVW